MEAAGRVTGNLIALSLAQGTWASYNRDWQGWRDWCTSIGADEHNEAMAMLLYVGHCHEAGWSVSRISLCMAGLALYGDARKILQRISWFYRL